MTVEYIQYTGTIKFGTSSADIDVSDDVIRCTYTRTYSGVERAATFANLRRTTRAGSFAETIDVDYYGLDTSAQTTIDGLISEAVFGATPSTELYFELIFDSAAVGASNQRFTGTVSVLEAMKGGTAGDIKQRSITFPVLTMTRASV